MFTDIVTSTDLIELIGDAAWEEMLSWHDRELRKAFAKARGDEVNHTGDGFFVAFRSRARWHRLCSRHPAPLARHRREHGFAPWVRIGLHSAEATRRGSDYSGRGVHIAARVGAAAGREEILATASVTTASNESTYALSEPRELELKGVRGTVEVRRSTGGRSADLGCLISQSRHWSASRTHREDAGRPAVLGRRSGPTIRLATIAERAVEPMR
jgi:class 3 adenylate cyclase